MRWQIKLHIANTLAALRKQKQANAKSEKQQTNTREIRSERNWLASGLLGIGGHDNIDNFVRQHATKKLSIYVHRSKHTGKTALSHSLAHTQSTSNCASKPQLIYTVGTGFGILNGILHLDKQEISEAIVWL